MGWNGSRQERVAEPVHNKGRRCGSSSVNSIRRFKSVFLTLFLIAIVIFLIVYLANHAHESPPIAEVTNRTEITSVKVSSHYIAPNKRAITKTGNKLNDALAEVSASRDLVKIDPMPESRSDPVDEPPRKRIFKTGVEQLMSWLMSVEPGDMPIPIPSMPEEERESLVSILVCKNKIADDDTEEIASIKDDVNYCKQEMLKFIQDGGEPNEFFDYYFHQLKFAFETRNQVNDLYTELLDDDPDMAEQFLGKANIMLDEKGIKQVKSQGLQESVYQTVGEANED